MPARLNNPYVSPTGGYSYHVKDTDHWIRGKPSMDALRTALGAHCRIHSLPLPSVEQIEEQMCFELGAAGADWCSDQLGLPVESDPGAPDCAGLSFTSIKQGTMTLLHAATAKRWVDREEAERRAKVCIEGAPQGACPQNRSVPGCKSCAMPAITSLVNRVRGDRRTALDDKLHSCCLCGCQLAAKIWVPLDILLAHTPAAQLDRFKAKASWCWMLEGEA